MRLSFAEILICLNFFVFMLIVPFSIFGIPLYGFYFILNASLILYINHYNKEKTNLLTCKAKHIISKVYPYSHLARKFRSLAGGLLLFHALFLSFLPWLVWLLPEGDFWDLLFKSCLLMVLQITFTVPVLFFCYASEKRLLINGSKRLVARFLAEESWQDKAETLDKLISLEMYNENYEEADKYSRRLNFILDQE